MARGWSPLGENGDSSLNGESAIFSRLVGAQVETDVQYHFLLRISMPRSIRANDTGIAKKDRANDYGRLSIPE